MTLHQYLVHTDVRIACCVLGIRQRMVWALRSYERRPSQDLLLRAADAIPGLDVEGTIREYADADERRAPRP